MEIIDLIKKNKINEIIDIINKDKLILKKPIYNNLYLIHYAINLYKKKLIKHIIEIDNKQLLLTIDNENIFFYALFSSINDLNIFLIDNMVIYYPKYVKYIFSEDYIYKYIRIFKYEDFRLLYNKYKAYFDFKKIDFVYYIIKYYYNENIFEIINDNLDIIYYDKVFINIINLFFDKKINYEFIKKIFKLYPKLLKLNYDNYDKFLFELSNKYYKHNNEFVEFIIFLLNNGLNYNKHFNYSNLLNEFIINNVTELINILLDKEDIKDSINFIDYKHQTTIFYALLHIFETDIIKKIIKMTDDINIQNIYGNTPLHLLFIRIDYLDYYDDIKNLKLDLFIKNKLNNRPIDNINKNSKKFIINKFKEHINKKYNNLKKYNKYCKNDNKKCNQFILNEIKNNLSIIPNYKFDIEKYDDIKIMKYKNVKYTLYNARSYHIFLYFYYLLKKYNNLIIPLNYNIDKNNKLLIMNTLKKNKSVTNDLIIDNNYYLLHNMRIIYNGNDYIIPINLDKIIFNTFDKYKKDYMIIYLWLMLETDSHANIILIDNIKKLIILYEPHGIMYDIKLNIYDYLDNYFNEKFKGFKFIKSKDYMDNIFGLQIISNEQRFNTRIDIPGFCLAWCIWFVELYLNNTKYDLKYLFNKTIKKMINMNIFIGDYIKNYANNLFEENIKYLKKYDIAFFEYYNYEYSDNEIKISNNKKHKKLMEHYDFYSFEKHTNKILNLLNNDLKKLYF